MSIKITWKWLLHYFIDILLAFFVACVAFIAANKSHIAAFVIFMFICALALFRLARYVYDVEKKVMMIDDKTK
jgi:hypothetical protein